MRVDRLRRLLLASLSVALVMSAHADERPSLPAGQKRHFIAEISWKNNTAYTPSDATGRAEFEIDLDSKTLSWDIRYEKLSSAPRGVWLHAPGQPGATGAPMINLATGELRPPVKGSAVLTDAQIEYLLTGWSYVLISTKKYPNGEARGQLNRARPEWMTIFK